MVNDDPPHAVPSSASGRAEEFDLHDGTIQALYGLGLRLENCIHLVDESPDDAKALLDTAISWLDVLIRELRSRINNLG